MYIGSIEAKLFSDENWYVYYDNGREQQKFMLEWAQNSKRWDRRVISHISWYGGTKKGFDINLNKTISDSVKIPVISSGGAENWSHSWTFLNTSSDAVALASILHYKTFKTEIIKMSCLKQY